MSPDEHNSIVLKPVELLDAPVRKCCIFFFDLMIIAFFRYGPLLKDPLQEFYGSPMYSYATSIFSVAVLFPILQYRLMKKKDDLDALMFHRDFLLIYFVKDLFMPMSALVIVHHIVCFYCIAGTQKFCIYQIIFGTSPT